MSVLLPWALNTNSKDRSNSKENPRKNAGIFYAVESVGRRLFFQHRVEFECEAHGAADFELAHHKGDILVLIAS